MTIPNKAEEKYKKYGTLNFSEASSMIQDVIGILETKCILGLDKAELSDSELRILASAGKEIGKLAEVCEQAIKVRFKYDYLTGHK